MRARVLLAVAAAGALLVLLALPSPGAARSPPATAQQAAALAGCLRKATAPGAAERPGAPRMVVLLPGDAGFAANAAFRNWQGRHDARRPAAVAFPPAAAGVRAAVACARAARVPFVARSGGHSYEAMSLLNGGLVIDLSNLTSVRWAAPPAPLAPAGAAPPGAKAAAGAAAGVAAVGAGVRLGALYKWAVHDQGLVFPGGTCPGVAVSGFLLGGGQGHSVRKLGLAADSVVGATLLTANGTVLEADEASYPDLFWAIRGGGANYAVVLEWRLQLYRQPKVVTTVMLDAPLSEASLAWLLRAFMEWGPWSLPEDVASLDLRIEGDTCGIKLVTWGPAAAARRLLGARLFAEAGAAINATTEFHEGSFEELILSWTKASGQLPPAAAWGPDLMGGFQTPAKVDPVKGYKGYRFGGGWDFQGAGFLLQGALPPNASAALAAVVVPHHLALSKAGKLAVAYMTVWGGRVAAPAEGATGFGWRRRPVNFQIGTPLRAGSAADAGYGRRVQEAVLPFTRGAMFYNYMSCLAGRDPYTRGDRWQAFFGPAAPRLRRIKQRYDPADAFAFGMQCDALD